MFGDPVHNNKGWRTDSVENLCKEIYGGGTPSKSHDEYYTEGNIPWVSSKDMKKDVITDSQNHIYWYGLSINHSENTRRLKEQLPAENRLVFDREPLLSAVWCCLPSDVTYRTMFVCRLFICQRVKIPCVISDNQVSVRKWMFSWRRSNRNNVHRNYSLFRM